MNSKHPKLLPPSHAHSLLPHKPRGNWKIVTMWKVNLSCAQKRLMSPSAKVNKSNKTPNCSGYTKC